MSTSSLLTRSIVWHTAAALALTVTFTVSLQAQQPRGGQSINFRVSAPSHNLEITAGTSRILTLDHDVPRLLNNDPDIVRAIALKSNEIQISARQPGVTDLILWDEEGKTHTIHIQVLGDSRALQEILRKTLPSASVRVTEIPNGGAMLTGYVAQAEDVAGVIQLAEGYYSTVINRMRVGGVQQVQLHVKVVEVSRTKLEQLGVDWAVLASNDFVIQSVSGLVSAAATQGGTLAGTSDTLRLGILNNGNSFGAYIDALRRNTLAKLLAEPTLITRSGRPARFQVGGQIPVPVPAGLGVTSIEYRDFGTEVDFVPIILGNGNIRLEVRGSVTEIDPSINVQGAPGFRSRMIDTGVEMKAGQTLALAGLVFNRMDSENRGIPFLSDIPWFGIPFRRVERTVNEVELLIMITPELGEALDPDEVPPCGPGQSTTIASSGDFYTKGFIEVPKCCLDGSCAKCRREAGVEEISDGHVLESSQDLGPVRGSGSDFQVQPRTPGGGSLLQPQLNDSGASRLPRIQENEFAKKSSSQPVVQTNPRFRNSSASAQKRLSNPDIRSNPPKTQSSKGTGKNEPMPTLIGPIGYDVLK